MNSDCHAALSKLYAERKEQGLIDVKFFVRGADEALADDLCEEALRMEEAIARGDVFPLDFRDLPTQ